MKIGAYTIPSYKLSHLTEAAWKINEKFQQEPRDPKTIALLLNLSPTSGGFLQKLADLRDYNLIEGRGLLRVTRLGKDIFEGTVSVEEAIMNIPLWRALNTRFGVTLPVKDFWADLAQITGVDAVKAKEKEKIIITLYQDAMSQKKSKPSLEANTCPKCGAWLGDYGYLRIKDNRVAITDANSLNIARLMLDVNYH